MVGQDCLLILSVFLVNQLARVFICLIGALVRTLDFTSLNGYDEDHLWPTPGKHLQGNPKDPFTGYVENNLKGKEQRMQKDEVFDKGKGMPGNTRISEGPNKLVGITSTLLWQ